MGRVGKVANALLLISFSRTELALVLPFTEGRLMSVLASWDRVDCVEWHELDATVNCSCKIMLSDLHLLNLVEHITLGTIQGLLYDGLLLRRQLFYSSVLQLRLYRCVLARGKLAGTWRPSCSFLRRTLRDGLQRSATVLFEDA